MAPGEPNIRRAGAGDLEEILDVCGAALGWSDRNWDRALFTWKHTQSPFGESIVVLAEDRTGILAVRPLMRWSFSSHQGRLDAARAVDTATRPDAQGRGVFRAVTEASLDMLRSEGVAFIFNTPNAASRPAYLRMGWHDAGTVPFGIRIRSALSIPRVLRSKVAASKPSIPTPELGVDARRWLETVPAIPRATGRLWRTAHDRETLLWRYAGGPVSYRALPMGETAAVIVRVRQRGHARELLIAERIGAVDEETERRILGSALKQSGATHLIGAAGTTGTLTSERVGPGLVMREVAVFHPDPDDMAWAPGDLELF